MNFMTRMELTEFSDAELASLFARISRELAQATEGSLAWQAAMASLENILREQGKRRLAAARPRPKPPELGP